MYVTIYDVTVSPKRLVETNTPVREVRTHADTVTVAYMWAGEVSYGASEFTVRVTPRPVTDGV